MSELQALVLLGAGVLLAYCLGLYVGRLRHFELVKAGALILAEIERLDRAEAAKTQPSTSGD